MSGSETEKHCPRTQASS